MPPSPHLPRHGHGRHLDGFNLATDHYVVAISFLSVGQTLTDVSNAQGLPNTVFLASGGLFIEGDRRRHRAQRLPQHRDLRSLVYDECQDATYDAGEDKLFFPAFEAAIPADPPDINPAIAQLKADAPGTPPCGPPS